MGTCASSGEDADEAAITKQVEAKKDADENKVRFRRPTIPQPLAGEMLPEATAGASLATSDQPGI